MSAQAIPVCGSYEAVVVKVRKVKNRPAYYVHVLLAGNILVKGRYNV